MPSPSLPIAHPIELEAPDIDAYREGNVGAPYVWRFEGDAPGPTAMISAIVHGNELCGAIALDWLMRRDFRPARGALVLAFVNVEAYGAFDPADPSASRWVDEDFNRVWDASTLDGPRDGAELRRARALRPVLDTVDALLDLHSMQTKAPPLMMAGPLAKGVRLARAVGAPRLVIVDGGHAAGRRMRDYGAFADPSAEATALLLEAGQHWEASSAPVSKEIVARFLQHLGMDDGGLLAALGAPAPEPQTIYEVTEPVTIRTDAFRFARAFDGCEIIPEAGTLLGVDGDREVRAPYDDCMLIMPSQRLWRGQTAVRLARRLES